MSAAPAPLGGGAGAVPLYGLHVVFGHQAKSGRWIREPTADFTCRYGCSYTTAGADQVAQFTKVIDAYHRRHCLKNTRP